MFIKSIIKTAILFSCIFAMHVVVANNKNVTIGLIDDSTVADTYGWGPGFEALTNDQVTVLNYAKNGATLDSLSNTLDSLIAQQPNYILIQFGHNDMHYFDAKTYSEKLNAYVERITQSGSKAIVLSSVSRRNFDKNGKIST
nr:GDSL-type esterase/lipase family protein [uncultured Amphritea sp.]